ncbi:PQQ-dependent sugar dehydrogenase [Colwellia sp. UCD-KL20]|uniref:PQQ-dependent sugar dehydrogenase n=1 Tax=Colwellia sp. UCD-KL20 TaxID=1917165 RepID=UPI0009FAA6A1|nr:PQQ-dependent sugar dehydrogenase [Colwellia sp. UCD-KL20]
MKLSIFMLLLTSFATQAVQLKEVITGIEQPTDVKFFPDSNIELLVAEKKGKLIFTDLLTKKIHTVHEFAVKSDIEMGLLGLVFHPDYSKNNFLFINYFPKEGKRRTRVSRFTLNKNAENYSLSNEKIILEIQQPYQNHNGGQLVFGPDKYLYIGMGDGGSAGDPKGHGQNTKTLLGNMLRIDINTNDSLPYAIPTDNPFIDKADFRPEIWAYGLRNPWRFSFAGDTLIVADVGQSMIEEVSVVEKGQNLGWNTMEGNKCFKPKKDCDQTGLTLPKVTYTHKDGLSITGGYVYTGTLIPDLHNHYIYADFILGGVWATSFPEFSTPIKLFDATGINLSTFALNSKGEIYTADYASGNIYQLVP